MYTCEGCGAAFEGTPEEAFEEGWDTPERFMSHCTCPNCTIDKTLWWRVVVLKETDLTEAEIKLLQGYNSLYQQYNETSLTTGDKCAGCDEVKDLKYHSSNAHVNSGSPEDVCQECHDQGKP